MKQPATTECKRPELDDAGGSELGERYLPGEGFIKLLAHEAIPVAARGIDKVSHRIQRSHFLIEGDGMFWKTVRSPNEPGDDD